jgi:hypothetical protein
MGKDNRYGLIENFCGMPQNKIIIMEQHIFAFCLFIEGAAEKVLQFIVQFRSIYDKKLGFTEQKMYF